MVESIKHCLGNLTNFNGRDSRRTFWLYVLFLVIISIIVAIINGAVFAASSMGTAFESAAAGASEAEVQAQVMGGMSGSMATQVWIGAAISLITLALFIAAFARRVRDGGFSVWIAIIPVITTLVGIYASVSSVNQMADAMASGDPAAMADMSGAIGLGLVSWIGYIVVIIFGVLPTKGAPRN